MIRPEPGSFADLMQELLVERFGTTDRDRPRVEPQRLDIDSPEAIARRQRKLNEALEDADWGQMADGTVVPLRRGRDQYRRGRAA